MNTLNFTDRQIEIMEAATKRIDQHGIQELTIKNLAADLNLSEAALYRHFKGKNDILLGILNYFIANMEARVSLIMETKGLHSSDYLRKIFISQLETFVNNPSIVSIIFSEGIFNFNQDLKEIVSEMMEMMHHKLSTIVQKGQKSGEYATLLSADHLATVIMGSMRMVVLKWKLGGHKSNIIKDGSNILNGLLKMLEK